MFKKMVCVVAIVALLVSCLVCVDTVEADSITIDGRNWTVVAPSGYSTGADSLTVNGDVGAFNHAATSISGEVEAGKGITFDMEVTTAGLIGTSGANSAGFALGWYDASQTGYDSWAITAMWADNTLTIWDSQNVDKGLPNAVIAAGAGTTIGVGIEFPIAGGYELTLDNGTDTATFANDRLNGDWTGNSASGLYDFFLWSYDQDQDITISNFTTGVVVPEPGTLSLLLGGLMCLLIWRRKK